MKKILLPLLLSLFFHFGSNAQDNDDSVSIMLTSDLLDADLYYLQKLHLSANQHVDLTGSVVSETSVLILPKPGCGILILPVSQNSYNAPPGTAAREKGGTTVIKSKGTGVGRPAPEAVVYPNPGQTKLNFYTTNNFAIGAAVYDMNGILKLSAAMQPATEGSVNVSNLPAGLYILKIDLIDTQFITTQFIKN